MRLVKNRIVDAPLREGKVMRLCPFLGRKRVAEGGGRRRMKRRKKKNKAEEDLSLMEWSATNICWYYSKQLFVICECIVGNTAYCSISYV